MPLEFMLSVLRDEGAPTKVRMWAATRAAPYCHARLRPVAANAGVGGVQVVYVTHEQRLDELEEIDALARLERERVDTDNQRAVRDYPAIHPVHGAV